MRRAWLAAFGCVAILSLSCGVNSNHLEGTGSVACASDLPPVPVVESSSEGLEGREQPMIEDARVESLLAYLRAQRMGLTDSELRALANTITEEVTRQQIDIQLILALMYVESRYKPFVVSPVGAIGLMQILPSTGEEVAGALGIEWYGPETLFDPIANVRIGITYVKQLTQRYDKVTTALAAYNWGMGTIDKRLRVGTPVPRVYPGLVMEAYDRTVSAVRS